MPQGTRERVTNIEKTAEKGGKTKVKTKKKILFLFYSLPLQTPTRKRGWKESREDRRKWRKRGEKNDCKMTYSSKVSFRNCHGAIVPESQNEKEKSKKWTKNWRKEKI